MATMFCSVCEAEVQPVIDIAETGKPVAVCGKGHTLGDAHAATDNPHREQSPPVTAENQKRDPASAVATAPKGGVMARGEPLDLVAAAKKRLQQIDMELERLAALQRERRKLAAMVAAAEAEEAAEARSIMGALLSPDTIVSDRVLVAAE